MLSVEQLQFLEDNDLDLDLIQLSAGKIDFGTEEKKEDRHDLESEEPYYEPLSNYPNLHDLETSNMFSNKLMADQAKHLAQTALDQPKIKQYEVLKEQLPTTER